MDKIWLKHYQQGVPVEINPDAYISLADLFTQSCNKFADRPAFRNFDQDISYRELQQYSEAFAAYLQRKLGLKKGDRLAIMLPNTLQYPVVLFGAFLAGLTVVNINPLYTAPELIHQINDSGAETIVVLNSFAHVVQKALPETALKNIIITNLGDLFAWPKSLLINLIVKYVKRTVPAWKIPYSIGFKKILNEGKKLRFNPVAIEGEDIAFLQYTGGTTGVAKGAMLTHRNMVANVEQVMAWIKPSLVEGQEIIVTPLPMYHVFSLTANCLSFICYGSLNVLITNPRDIPHLVAELKKVPFTAITGVNTLFNALLHNPDFAKLNFKALKIALGGGAALQQSVADRWYKITGKVLYEGYGLTETSPVVTVIPLNYGKYNGSIGLPVPSTDVSFRNGNGKEVAFGEVGELAVKGPQVMKGYWKNPDETQKAFTADGWLLTGDMATMDQDGFVYIVDRKKDIIIVSGFNVYPNEVEEVLASHPAVLEVAVIGVPDQNSGEAVKAFVVRKDENLTAEDLRAYCRERLTGYKIPKIIEFRETLPKSPVGKVLRRLLRD